MNELRSDLAIFKARMPFRFKMHSLTNRLWWKFPGNSVIVKWPTGYLDDVKNPCSEIEIYSADPNEFYRPWLETNVGKQGFDWDWRIDSITGNNLEIKFRMGKGKEASLFTLIYK